MPAGLYIAEGEPAPEYGLPDMIKIVSDESNKNEFTLFYLCKNSQSYCSSAWMQDVPPISWLIGMISETTEPGGNYIRGTPPVIQEQVVSGAPVMQSSRFRAHPGQRAPFSPDRVVSIYLRAKQPNPTLRPRRGCADPYVDIRASSPPLPDFRKAETKAVQATLRLLERTLRYRIPDYSSIKIHALDRNEAQVTSMALTLSKAYPQDGVSKTLFVLILLYVK